MNSLLDVHRIPCDELDQLLAMFVLSDSNTDGQEYKPSYLRPVINSGDRKLCRKTYGHKIMENQDDYFRLTRDVL